MNFLQYVEQSLNEYGIKIRNSSHLNIEHPVDLLTNFLTITTTEPNFEDWLTVEKTIVKNEGHVSPIGNVIADRSVRIQPFNFLNADKGPIFLGKNVKIGPFNFLRGPLFIGDNTIIGSYCELNRSIILKGCNISHYNFISDSILGENVWFAGYAGTINTKITGKHVRVAYDKLPIKLTKKFGATIENDVKIPALCAVMPGVHITPKTELISPYVVHKDKIIVPFGGSYS